MLLRGTDERRGFCVVSLAKNARPHVYFKTNQSLSTRQVDGFVKQWASWLGGESTTSCNSHELLEEAVSVLGVCSRELDRESYVLTHERLHHCSADHMYCTSKLFEAIRLSDIYLTLHAMPAFSAADSKHVWMWRGEERRHKMAGEVTAAMVTTMMLYSWPYCINGCGSTNGERLAMLVASGSSKLDVVLQREIAYLKQQFSF